MDADVNLGGKPSKCANRDAVHIAVAPMVAGESLKPGDHVSVRDGKCFATGNLIGIVDPYRRTPVAKGEPFWLCLYPKTVTSLRHHWTCPALPASTREEIDAELRDSERWLREYAKRMNPYDKTEDDAFERLIEGLKDGALHAYGHDLCGIHDLDDASELKYHAERYLGIRINFDNFTFSCSC